MNLRLPLGLGAPKWLVLVSHLSPPRTGNGTPMTFATLHTSDSSGS